MNRSILVALGLAVVLPAFAIAQSTATAPALTKTGSPGLVVATAPAANFATPKDGVLSLASAVGEQNTSAIRNALLISADNKVAVDTLLDTIAASARLQKAVEKKFGPDAVKDFRKPGILEENMANASKNIDQADIATADDNATVTLHPDKPTNNDVLRLNKVDGNWKVDSAALLHLNDPATKARLDKALPTFRRVTEAYNRAAGDLDAGKIQSLPELRNQLTGEILAATRPATTATAPATRP